MAMKFKKSAQKAPPPWMVTMGDMNNLLMCFFIIMMGEDVVSTKNEDYQMMISSFRGSLGVFDGGRSISKGRLAELGSSLASLPSQEKGKAISKAQKKALNVLRPEVEAKVVRIQEDERGLVITLSSDAFFEPGSARLNAESRDALARIAVIIREVQNFIRIEGHTDNRQLIQQGVKEGYSNNWDLSAARAINVLRYFAEEHNVKAKKLSAVAFGQFRPIDDNNTPEGRAFNRRVDIVILRDRFQEESKDPRIEKPLPDEEWR